MSIGKRIRVLRTRNKLTQDQLGEICDATKGAVSQWESDATIPATRNLLLLHEKLDFSLDWLLLGLADYTIKQTHSLFINEQTLEPIDSGLLSTLYELAKLINDDGLRELIGFARCLTGTHPAAKAKRA
ncbi:MAG: helix-turn-helix domain-containing protein [Gammaproteobacteria bacterium]|nr:helix-turn-helix domain-containing protein [Gammaproteobacteria bacterium]MBU3987755.1 helix-turn-helix domain-containing protein [Gammaproteobacteria bacterium]MBU4003366.1 helix-turn-helix domain-containing protein [Gammaproteobacteria bacterium]MBU4021837.1 helix-turn-helix domain-containing protein [Gammaproteobacteria bacterium]MBU4096536.1 helix-turn-helix domain-containing protein [Gammaproteobacteria bacterium]